MPPAVLGPVQLLSQKPCLTAHLRATDVAVAVLALQHLSADALVTVLRHKDGQGLNVSHIDFQDSWVQHLLVHILPGFLRPSSWHCSLILHSR